MRERLCSCGMPLGRTHGCVSRNRLTFEITKAPDDWPAERVDRLRREIQAGLDKHKRKRKKRDG